MKKSLDNLYPVRPTVHVGVTGHRKLSKEETERIDRQVKEVLDVIKEATTSIVQQYLDIFKRYHTAPVPQLRVISPLAEGADRIVARQALALGYSLHCPLPFSRKFYESSFEESDVEHTEFRSLLRRAESVFEVAAGNEKFTSQAYADIGDLVINHSDFLIAIWDGQPGRYIAGTYATIQAALKQHIPVIIVSSRPISADHPHADDIIYQEDGSVVKAWQAAVQNRLKQILLPRLDGNTPLFPALSCKNNKNIEWQKFFEDCLLVRQHLIQQKNSGKQQATKASAPKVSEVWQQRKSMFSSLVSEIGVRYRNSLLGRQLFPLLATVFLTLALNCPYLPIFHYFCNSATRGMNYIKLMLYCLQIISIITSLYLVWRDRRSQNHRRFYNYRVLAELCRQTMFFYPMAFCNVRYRHRTYQNNDGDSETSWYYRMLLRSDGLPHTMLTHADLKNWLIWLKQSFLQPQRKYHEKRAIRCSFLKSRLEILVLFFFVVGLLSTIGRALLDSTGTDAAKAFLAFFASLALICPPAAVFFASFSNNASYPIHYGISVKMQTFFDTLLNDLSSIENIPEEQISYTDVLRICRAIDYHCRDELADWEDTLHSRALKWV